jgi:hypothetical protein
MRAEVQVVMQVRGAQEPQRPGLLESPVAVVEVAAAAEVLRSSTNAME